MKKIHLTILSIGAAFLMSSCYYDNLKELHPESQKACDTTNTITYQADVKAILDANCVSCHSGGGTPSLVDYQNVISSYSGEQLYNSLLAGATNPMPKGASPLSAADIAKIKQWIDGCQPNGAFVSSVCDTSALMSYSLNIEPILSANCTNGCHDNIGFGHTLLTYTDVINDTAGGYLVNSLTTPILSKKMPLGRAALSECQIAKIRRWVAEGANDN